MKWRQACVSPFFCHTLLHKKCSGGSSLFFLLSGQDGTQPEPVDAPDPNAGPDATTGFDEDARATADDMKWANRAHDQCLKMQLPAAPTSLVELFRYHERFAQKLLVHSSDAARHLNTLKRNMSYDLELHEAYSGLGTVGAMLHCQHDHLWRECFLFVKHQIVCG